jgi:hypothetical protein
MSPLVIGQGQSQESYVHAIAEIINALIKAFEAQVPINVYCQNHLSFYYFIFSCQRLKAS